MAKTIGKLTALDVTRAKAAGLYGDGGNLWLQVGPTGAKSWIFRYSLKNKNRAMGLGPLSTVTLSQARAAAADKRLLLLRGKDPIAEQRAEEALARLIARSEETFASCAERYVEAHKSSWKSVQHLTQWKQSLKKHVTPLIGTLPIGSIDTVLVLSVLEPIWTEIPATARRLRGRIEQVLDWAKARNMRTGENPARWRGHLENLLPKKSKLLKVKHHPSLPYSEIGNFMVTLRAQKCFSARALEFTILTASRTMEVLKAKWDEVDLDGRVWTVPAVRMKASREHRVPLSSQAIALLERMKPLRRPGDLLFPGTKHEKSMSDHTMLMLLKLTLGVRNAVPHGFRSTFRDWAAETTSYPREVCEAALAHSNKSETEAAYFRSDLFAKRETLMQSWSDYCDLPSVKQKGNVVVLKAVG